MNAFQLKKFRNQYHKQSEHIFSFDFRKTPPELRRMVSDVEFQAFLNLPYSRTDVGRILRTFKIKKNVEVTDNGKIII